MHRDRKALQLSRHSASLLCVTLAFSVLACSDAGEKSDGRDAASAGSGSSGKGTGGAASGGTSTGTGGAASGGTSTGTGGAASGGTSTGTGGAASGGSPASGGMAGSSASGVADPAEIARVTGWLTNTASGLPGYAYSNIKKNFPTTDRFDVLVHAIVVGCAEFAPAEANWLEYCEAVITSAIVAESSYDPSSDVTDGYATRTVSGTTANDPTVGLLQIRLSSTVHDYDYYGSFEKMTAIGCAWPAELKSQKDDATYWATQGGTTYLAFMQDVSCNIGLAAWYYFMNATGNGGASPTYAAAYCQGKGVAGTMVIGLLSHLQGPGFARPPDAANTYVTGIKGRFASLLGGLPNPDPFSQALAPEPAKFCR